MTEEKRDYRQEVTNEIIKLLEDGAAPWQKPWESGKAGRLPMNPTTGKPYRGGNTLHLMIQDMRKGYGDPRWVTYKQAADHGWQVRKGEKGTQIEFWDVRKPSDEGESDADKPHMIHRIYTVFNAQQIEGIPPVVIEPRKPFEVIEAGENILAHSGADIRHGGDRAFYNRGNDHIQLPHREQFIDAPAYYGTALHELAHWSGHPKRLNRPTLTESYRFGDQQYAKEELVADLASCFMSAERGIPYDPKQTAAYVASWIEALKKDKNEIFRAASAASAATDYVLGLENGRAPEEPVTPATQEAGPHVRRILGSGAEAEPVR